MKRRLEIARGLLHTPKILFLDEPTLGLDPQSRNQLWTHVKHLNETEHTTVFLTTHYMDEADRVAHRIAIIDHGQIVAQGTSAELKEQTKTDSLEGAYPRAHRNVHSRRKCQRVRRHAPGCADVETIKIWVRFTFSGSANSSATFARRVQIVVSLGQPVLYLVGLGFGLGPVFQTGREGKLPAVHGRPASSA